VSRRSSSSIGAVTYAVVSAPGGAPPSGTTGTGTAKSNRSSPTSCGRSEYSRSASQSFRADLRVAVTAGLVRDPSAPSAWCVWYASAGSSRASASAGSGRPEARMAAQSMCAFLMRAMRSVMKPGSASPKAAASAPGVGAGNRGGAGARCVHTSGTKWQWLRSCQAMATGRAAHVAGSCRDGYAAYETPLNPAP
jgi:hypothetical protein